MAGYLLIQDNMLKPRKLDGIVPNPYRLGFLDYARELRRPSLSFQTANEIIVVGLEDVLLATGRNLSDSMSYLHSVLSFRANELERIGGFVQIVFRRRLVRADDFWFEDGTHHISLRRLFDSPEPCSDTFNNEFYTVGFNLT